MKLVQLALILLVAASANADFWGWITGTETTAAPTTAPATTTTTTAAPTTTTTAAPTAATTAAPNIFQSAIGTVQSWFGFGSSETTTTTAAPTTTTTTAVPTTTTTTTTAAPETTTTTTTTTTTPVPETTPTTTTTTTTTTPAPTTPETTTVAATTLPPNAATVVSPAAGVVSPVVTITNSNTPITNTVLDAGSNLQPITTDNFSPFDPFGLISQALSLVGTAISVTGDTLLATVDGTSQLFGNALGAFVSSPAEKDILTCLGNVVEQGVGILFPIANMLPSCSVQLDSEVIDMTNSMLNIVMPLRTSFINSLLSLFSCKADMRTCFRTLISDTANNLSTAIDTVFSTSKVTVPIATTRGQVSLECMKTQVVDVAKQLPLLIKGLSCLTQ